MLRRPIARALRAVAPLLASASVATVATVVAAPLATPLAAQVAPGSRLVFGGVASALDLGTPGVRLDFLTPATVDRDASSRTFRGEGNTAPTFTLASFVVGAGPQRVSPLFTLGQYTFTLTELPSSTYGLAGCLAETPAVGQRCSPLQLALANQPPVPPDQVPVSPFYLENVASGNPDAPIDAYVAFDFLGTVTGPGGQTNAFRGTIATLVPGVDFLTVLRALEGSSMADTPFTIPPYLGTIVTGDRITIGADDAPTVTTPEPTTWALLGVGLAGVGAVARRRRTTTTA